MLTFRDLRSWPLLLSPEFLCVTRVFLPAGEESLCPVSCLSPAAPPPTLACEHPGSRPRPSHSLTPSAPQGPFSCPPISHPLLINSWSRRSQDPHLHLPCSPQCFSLSCGLSACVCTSAGNKTPTCAPPGPVSRRLSGSVHVHACVRERA